MRVLVLGGYGFIGLEIARALLARGADVIGLGRDPDLGRRLLPQARWIGADMAQLVTPRQWAPMLDGVDAIVNAAGALQDSPRDHLAAVHHLAISACVAAAEAAGVKRFVQISAVGAGVDASTAFMSTKAKGDDAVKASSLDWVILRPGLVIGRNAYGGTQLIRMLAAIPFVEALAYPDAMIQTVSIDDVVDAARRAIGGEVALRRAYDLVEDEPQTLRDIVRAFRGWQGFAQPPVSLIAPRWAARLVSAFADAAGVLGWRSPLRTAAIRVIAENVLGDPAPWRAAGGGRLKTLAETLRDMPATAQERIYARASLALPVMVGALSVFWIASGLIGAAQIDRAAALLPQFGAGAARAAVVAGAVADIAIGLALLVRRTVRRAAIAAAGLAALYLALGTVLAPQIWADPLGAYVKILPAIVLALALALILEER
jgi:uncharacterized protein YbjT (DUF2867 family)